MDSKNCEGDERQLLACDYVKASYSSHTECLRFGEESPLGSFCYRRLAEDFNTNDASLSSLINDAVAWSMVSQSFGRYRPNGRRPATDDDGFKRPGRVWGEMK